MRLRPDRALAGAAHLLTLTLTLTLTLILTLTLTLTLALAWRPSCQSWSMASFRPRSRSTTYWPACCLKVTASMLSSGRSALSP